MEDAKRERVEGGAVSLPGDDVDTDRIIPARFLKEITFEELGRHAFADERFDARRVAFDWSRPGFAAEGWVPVDVGHEGEFALTAHGGQPAVAVEPARGHGHK